MSSRSVSGRSFVHNAASTATVCSIMATAQRKALSDHWRRMKNQGIVRPEVRVHKVNVSLVRDVVSALEDPERANEARTLLRERFGTGKPKGLKALLAAAPLEGIELSAIGTSICELLDRHQYHFRGAQR